MNVFKFVVVCIIQPFMISGCIHFNKEFSPENSYPDSELVEVIRHIDIQIRNIDKKLHLCTQSLEKVTGIPSEGGEITRYICNGSLTKIKAIYIGNIEKHVRNFYYKNNQLIYIEELESLYGGPITNPSSSVITRRTKYYYFSEHRLCFLKQKIESSNSIRLQQEQKLLLQKEETLFDEK